MTWMGRRDAKPQKGVEARIPFLGLVTVVTASYYFQPMRRRNAKRMQLGGMQIIVLLASVVISTSVSLGEGWHKLYHL